MPADFYPKREADIVHWTANFGEKINAAPMEFGLDRDQATDYAMLQSSFAELHQAASEPSQRTPTIIQEKNTARIELEDFTRVLAGIVRAHREVTVVQRLELGLSKRNPGGPRGARGQRATNNRAIAPGIEAPLLGITSLVGGTAFIRLRDRSSPFSGKKPKGIHGATLFVAVGELPPAVDTKNWTFAANVTRNVSKVNIRKSLGRVLPPGTKVWLKAFWNNTRMQRGPFCEPVYTYTQYGLQLAA